jgi:hypothetical protein
MLVTQDKRNPVFLLFRFRKTTGAGAGTGGGGAAGATQAARRAPTLKPCLYKKREGARLFDDLDAL